MTQQRRNHLILFTVVVVLIVAGAVVSCGPPPDRLGEAASESSPVRIGAILPLTGQSAFLGESEKLGVELAVATVNAGGGLGGRPVEIIYGDSQNQAKESIAEYRRIWQVEGAPAIIASHSAVASTISGLMRNQPVDKLPVLMSIISNATDITENSEMVFRCYPTGYQEAVPMARFAHDDLGLRRVALYVQNDDYGLDGRQTFESEFVRLGGEIVAAETFEKDAKDHRSTLQKLKRASPEGIYVVGNTNAYGTAFRQIREQGIDAELLTGSAFGVAKYRELAGEAAEGVYAMTTIFESQLRYEHPTSREFIERFREAHGEEPSFLEAFAYSAVMILARAVEEAGDATPAEIQGVLADPGRTYDLPIGEIRFTESRDAELHMVLQRFTGGEFEVVESALSADELRTAA